MNVDYWDRRRWHKELTEQDVWVMTPQILLNILRHGFLKVWMEPAVTAMCVCVAARVSIVQQCKCCMVYRAVM